NAPPRNRNRPRKFQMDHAPSSPCGLVMTALRNMMSASAAASPNKAVRYHGTPVASAHLSSSARALAVPPSASAIMSAAAIAETKTVKLGPAVHSVRKYKQDAIPAPAPIA